MPRGSPVADIVLIEAVETGTYRIQIPRQLSRPEQYFHTSNPHVTVRAQEHRRSPELDGEVAVRPPKSTLHMMSNSRGFNIGFATSTICPRWRPSSGRPIIISLNYILRDSSMHTF